MSASKLRTGDNKNTKEILGTKELVGNPSVKIIRGFAVMLSTVLVHAIGKRGDDMIGRDIAKLGTARGHRSGRSKMSIVAR